MNDDLEQLEKEAAEIRTEKSEAEVLVDHYVSQLKHITNPDVITQTLIRKEVQERKIEQLKKDLAKKASEILEFNF